MVMQGGGSATRGDATTSQKADINRKRGTIGRGCGGGRVKRARGGGVNMTTSLQTRDKAKEKATAMATKNAVPAPSRDLVTAALVLAAEALAALKTAIVAALVLTSEAVALVLTAEAATTLMVEDANGGNDSIVIVSAVSLAMGGGVIN